VLGAGFGAGSNLGIIRSEADAEVEFHASVTAGKSDLFLVFGDPLIGAAGFDQLVIRIRDDTAELAEIRFEDEAEATRFLDGSQIDVGDIFAPARVPIPPPFPGGPPRERLVPELFDLTVSIEVSGIHASGTGVSTSFRIVQGAAVPELSIIGSLASALLLIAGRRRLPRS
jgi:hypothetical protein